MIPSQTFFTRPLQRSFKEFLSTRFVLWYSWQDRDSNPFSRWRWHDTSALPNAEAILFIIQTSSFLCKSPFFSDPLSSSRVSPMDPVILLSLDCTMLQLSVWISACSYVAPLSGQCSIWGARCLGTGLWATGEPGQGQGSLMHPEYYTDNCRRSRKANGGGYNYISALLAIGIEDITLLKRWSKHIGESPETWQLLWVGDHLSLSFFVCLWFSLRFAALDRLIETITDGPMKGS